MSNEKIITITVPPPPPIEIKIPKSVDWANWMAIDRDGNVFVYEKEPDALTTTWDSMNGGIYAKISHIAPRPDWQTLKFEIKR